MKFRRNVLYVYDLVDETGRYNLRGPKQRFNYWRSSRWRLLMSVFFNAGAARIFDRLVDQLYRFNFRPITPLKKFLVWLNDFYLVNPQVFAERVKQNRSVYPNHYLRDKNDSPFIEIQFNRTWRGYYIGRSFSFDISKNAATVAEDRHIFNFSLLFLENYPNIFDGKRSIDLVVEATGICKKTGKEKFIRTARVPINKRSLTNPTKHFIGRGILNGQIELPEANNIQLQVETRLIDGKGDEYKFNHQFIAFGSPFISHRVKTRKPRRILAFLLESITDKSVLQSQCENILNCSLFEIFEKEKFNEYKLAYSQGDYTMPAFGSYMTGLPVSRHGMGKRKLRYPKAVKLNQNIATLGDIAKKNGFTTFAQLSAHARSFSGDYGMARGFDFYDIYDPNNFQKIIEFLDDNRDRDTFSLVHVNFAHLPIGLPIADTNDTFFHRFPEFESREGAYSECLQYHKRVQELIFIWLKANDLWDSTAIIATGDHGAGIGNWGRHGKFGLFEQRVRVPFYYKGDHAYDLSRYGQYSNDVVNSTTGFFEMASHLLGEEIISDSVLPLAYEHETLGRLAISETVHRPKDTSYTLAVSNAKFKYIYFADVDWKNKKRLRQTDEALYMRNNSGIADERCDIKNKSPDERCEFRRFAEGFLEVSLRFQGRYGRIECPLLPDIIL